MIWITEHVTIVLMEELRVNQKTIQSDVKNKFMLKASVNDWGKDFEKKAELVVSSIQAVGVTAN